MTLRMRARIVIMLGLLALTMAAAHSLERGDVRVRLRKPLADTPVVLDGWHGTDLLLSPSLAAAAGVDDYLYRSYVDASGDAVEAYVGYYQSQSSGKLIHSPKHCLPGAGWQPVRTGLVTVPIQGSRSITVNEYLVDKDLKQLLVLYWYQGRGRVVASEYTLKFWNVTDAVRLHRTDGALVRLSESTASGEIHARAVLLQFAALLYPRLEQMLPK